MSVAFVVYLERTSALGPVYTNRKRRCCDNSLKTIESLQNELQPIFERLYCFQWEQNCRVVAASTLTLGVNGSLWCVHTARHRHRHRHRDRQIVTVLNCMVVSVQCEHLNTILYNPFFIGVCIGLGVGQCEHTFMRPVGWHKLVSEVKPCGSDLPLPWWCRLSERSTVPVMYLQYMNNTTECVCVCLVCLPPANEVTGRYCLHTCLSVILFGGGSGQTPPRQTPSPRLPLQRTVRILLECILVVMVLNCSYF